MSNPPEVPPCPHVWIQSDGRCICGELPHPKHEHRLTQDSGQYVCMDCHEIVFVAPELVVVVDLVGGNVDDLDDEHSMFPLPLPWLLIRMYWASYDNEYEHDVPVSWYVDTMSSYLEAQHDTDEELPDDYDMWAELAQEVSRER